MSARTNLKIRSVIVALVLVTAAPTFAGRIIYVDDDGPSDFNNIQPAIDDANDGDTIIVADGFYANPPRYSFPAVADFHGKAITLQSENGPRNCILRSGCYIVLFESGETAASILSGFTIRSAESSGILCHDSSPTIMNNIITGNWSELGHASVCVHNSSPIIVGNVIAGNDVYGVCAGIGCFDGSSATITNNTILNNGNLPSYENGEGAVYCDETSTATITNCIFWNNNGDYDLYNCSATYSCTEHAEPGIGNIDIAPMFVYPDDGDYHLNPDSPCIDTGDPNYVPEPNETDLDGNPRIIGGRIDMGVYEFQGRLILYVDDDAAGINDGSSWANAHNFLQDALAVAYSGDEIWVAQGIYKPDEGIGITPGDREATFQLISGVTLKGGYAGFGEPDPDVRYIALYETILSGDIGTPTDRSDNCYHVFYHPEGLNLDATAIIDGFTITSGNATLRKSPSDRGGGMYNYESSPTVKGCTFIDNHAWPHGGGGMYNSRSNPTVKDCIFRGNFSHAGGGGMYNTSASSPIVDDCIFTTNDIKYNGGGMYNSYDSNPIVTNCTFNANKIHGYGGGMYNLYSSPTIRRCTFSNNRSSDSGGGMYNDRSNTIVENCIFSNNRVTFGNGGGMYNWLESPKIKGCTFSANSVTYGSGGGMFNRSSPIVEVCTFIANSASDDGGGMFNDYSSPTITNCTFSSNSANNDGGGMYNWYSKPMVTNCILWSDTPDEIYMHGGMPVITYSDIQGGWPGEGNIDADPCFVEPGYWGHKEDPNIVVEPNDPNALWIYGDYHLLPDSPCIDTGDPNYIAGPNETDLDGKPRVLNGNNDGITVIDMGAYEHRYTIFAEARIVPRTINLASKGKWIGCYIWLPENYNVADIDPNSVFLEDEIKAESLLVDEQEQIAIAKFSRSELQAILSVGDAELTITGQLMDGTLFEATDVIRVTGKAGQKAGKLR